MYAPRTKQITFIYASPRRQRPQQRRNSPKSLHARQYITKIKQSRSWQDAFDLLKEMEANNIKPDHFHSSTAISVCARKDHWKQAIQLLKEMTNRGVQPSVFCYNAAINACGRGAESPSIYLYVYIYLDYVSHSFSTTLASANRSVPSRARWVHKAPKRRPSS